MDAKRSVQALLTVFYFDFPDIDICLYFFKIFYCSEQCQSFDWRRHKTECKEASREPQRLPSQVRTDQLMVEFGQFADFATSDLCAEMLLEHLEGQSEEV